ncbi:GNAT family N-acetyltransferase [Ureibacillus chungkukjangi]|uniref:Ribosomal-protein-serine acetyltransferase n=1 Tax=Ureibacillus chungkukjangi TaxID=1202712 RepID=A0A318TN92_9BACL|nr:GNAT family protein [Ureibacillus chungkukjangi]MCM3390140.1 GNAT family N-acetyltransferase [Ureibacillus chungkukjangi]PYF06332.1 ribosomal-protein-serine acetyltransferase [Ureibacillus chungkukjangi]
MFIYPVDEEISLKLVTERDAEEVFQMIDSSRTYFREWLGWLDYSTKVQDTVDNIKGNLLKFVAQEGLDTAIVFNGKIVGKIGFNKINKANKTAYIGYMLDEAFQGKGIMTRATKAMVNIAFEEYGLNKVEIHAAEGNTKSRSIPVRLGFKEEGTIRSAEWLYSQYVDHVVYGMLKEEWK